jgi:hypothetical protein
MPTLNANFFCPYCKGFNIRKTKKPLASSICEKCGKKIDLNKIKVKYTVQNLGG